jgi:hypothetical protein
MTVENYLKHLLLLSEGDWGLDYLQVLLGEHLEQWRGSANPNVEVLTRTDHTFTSLVSQQRALRLIVEWTRDLARNGILASVVSFVYGL